MDDPLAAQRSELLAQVLAAQYGLENALAALIAAGAHSDEAQSQMQALADLQKQIATATPTSLTFLRGDVAGAAAACRTLAQEARAISLSERNNETPSARARAAIQRLTSDLFERRVLDPYLQFASPEDEAAYRERERERREAIERAQASGTPEGEQTAARLTEAQIRDAGAHGATASPDYEPMLRSAQEARATLEATPAQSSSAPATDRGTPLNEFEEAIAALQAAGVSTLATAVPGHGLNDGQRAPSTSVGPFRA